jgi:hypothetical protein
MGGRRDQRWKNITDIFGDRITRGAQFISEHEEVERKSVRTSM